MPGVGFRVHSEGFGDQSLAFRAHGVGFGVQRFQVSGFTVWGSGSRVWGSEFGI